MRIVLWADFPDFADLVRCVSGTEAVCLTEINCLHALAGELERVDYGSDGGRALCGKVAVAFAIATF